MKTLLKKTWVLSITSILLILLTPASHAQITEFEDDYDDYAYETEQNSISDPLVKYNQFMFKVNHKIYKHLFTPLSKGYDFLIPKKVQSSVNNFFTNVGTPQRFGNNLLQLKWKYALTEFSRFVINSTIGIGGFFDPAQAAFHLEKHDEDLGQTLGHYGAGPGPYIVWPIIGPSTLRDTIGVIGDNAFDPTFWFGVLDTFEEDEILFAVSMVERVNKYSYTIRDNYDRIINNAFDPYTSLQHAYIENRKKKIEE
ncbi:MAG: VacJ family lipoprotein [Candidatus Omnitrophica bacterium]|nr:VacJ family lipoprotein [Candidatus Omnitrophota bacterium]MCB9747836.1 VacJ family lipoprotein [Candidatus Omnitrophota bacterium]